MSPGSQAAKRGFDVVVASIAAVLLSPVFLTIAALIKLDTRGSVFFRQERAGANGTTFRIFKFRTMIVGAYRSGARLTVKRDARITNVGEVLRWTKLDELPQLFNVILGDMALVGPRPEDPYFTNFYDEEQREVLSVRPGIIGPSQLEGRDEVEKYPDGCENIEEFYVEHILPAKLAGDLEYVRTASFWGDLRFLIAGTLRVILSQVKGGFFYRSRYRFAALAADIVLMIGSYVLANLIKFDWKLAPNQWAYIGWTLLWIVTLKPPIFLYYGVYRGTIQWVGRREAAAIVKAVSVSSAFVVAAATFSGLQDHSRAVFIIDWALLIFLIGGVRYVVRNVMRGVRKGKEERRFVKVLVAGSGHGGEAILRSLLEDPNSHYMPVGIIDHEPHRWGALIHGVRVMGGATDIAMAASTHGVEMVLVSLSDMDPVVLREITEACQSLNLPCRLVPALSDLLSEQNSQSVDRIALSTEARI